jgi:prolyl oligopeptidase
MIGSNPCARLGPFALCATVALLAVSARAAEAPPTAPVRPVVDQYFGTDVTDNYRYMENLKDPEVQAWMKAQADHTRDLLDALPGRQALLRRIHELYNQDVWRGGVVRRGQRYFYLEIQPETPLPKLFYRDGLKGGEHLLIDPAALGKVGDVHYALDYFSPSWDGKYVAYALAAGGSEQDVIHVLEVSSGKALSEAIDRASEGHIGWRPDNTSFFYLRFPKPGPRTPPSELHYNSRAYLHVLGENVDGDADPAVFGRGVSSAVDVPEGQAAYVVTTPDSAYALAVANHNDDENPSTLFLEPLAKVTGAASPWRKIAEVGDGVTKVSAHGDKLYFLSQKGASHFRLLTTPLSRPDIAAAKVIVPDGPAVLTDFSIAREGLYVGARHAGREGLSLVSFDGTRTTPVPMPFEGTAAAPVTDPRELGLVFAATGWVHPVERLSYDPATKISSDTGLIPPSRIDTSGLEAKEAFATSYDGVRVPVSIVYKKGLRLDGSNPTILEGYGSYGIVESERFSQSVVSWVERGGVYAIAHVRGGGELGEDWHRGGFMSTKLNTILDFIACAQYLVDAGYSSPKYLAAEGGSAGGITVGGAMTWRPDLFGVILDAVGMSDTLRFETEPNGPPNVSEFGSIKTEAGFHGLYAMSAYAHVRDGVAYPSVLFMTGANDPRVSPWHMAKMAARVQAATSSGRPVLLRVDYDAGHGGIGATEDQVESMIADEQAFALWQMGVPAFTPPAKP